MLIHWETSSGHSIGRDGLLILGAHLYVPTVASGRPAAMQSEISESLRQAVLDYTRACGIQSVRLVIDINTAMKSVTIRQVPRITIKKTCDIKKVIAE
jgi:hypothetical protein